MQIGIEVYSTSTEGIGGKIREKVEDFRVNEITNIKEDNDNEGDYLIVELTKRNWDTHHAIAELARFLHISKKRISWAGTKDKRAVTKQLLSIHGVKEEKLEGVNVRGIEIKKVGYSRKPVYMGDLYGNEFEIVIRGIDHSVDETMELIALTSDQIKENGVPNFFGEQRFGEQRPITHMVGREIVRGDFERAAMIYIAKPFPDESEEARAAREYIWETGDFKVGYEGMPVFLRYERAMLNHLIRSPEDYIGAFRTLQTNLLRLFVHAYQSFIFNKILSSRLKNGIPMNEAQVGDIVCFKNEIGFPDVRRTQRVKHDNIKGIDNLIKRGRAFVTAPIVGYETVLSNGAQGEIEREILDELDINPDDFRIPQMEEINSRGLRRVIMLRSRPKYEIGLDELNLGKSKVKMEFTLPKGSYATVVLHEFMKIKK